MRTINLLRRVVTAPYAVAVIPVATAALLSLMTPSGGQTLSAAIFYIAGVGAVLWLLRLEYGRKSELDRQRKSFQVTLASIGDAVIATDASGRVTFMNGVSQEMTGWRESEAAGRPLAEVFKIVNEYTRETVESPVERVMKEGVIVGLANHTTLISRDGREIPIDDSGAPIRDEHEDTILGVVLVFRDITERKKAEQELEKAKRQIETILAGITDGVMVMDKSGTILYANYTAARLLDYPSTNSLMKTDADSVARKFDIRDEAGNPMELSDLPGRRALRGQLDPECVVRFRSGTRADEQWARVKAVPFFDANGDVLFAISTFHDITPQKRAELAQRFLAEASKRLASSLDYETTLASIVDLAIPDLADGCSIDILGEDGSIKHVNIGFVDPQQTQLMQKIRTLYPYDPSRPNPIVEVLRTGRSMLLAEVSEDVIKASARTPEHHEMLVKLGVRSAVLVPLRLDERKFGLLTLMITSSAHRFTEADLFVVEEVAARAALAIENARLYSISERQRSEAERATRLKDEFLANLSHELRTPLNAIVGWVRLLRGGQLNSETTQRALETIERNAGLQAQLIDDLLDMSRIISGKFRMEFGTVDLAAIVLEVVDSIRPAADAKGIHIRTAFAGNATTVSGDSTRLRQVVWNLLSNAVKFTPRDGTVDVTVNRTDSAVRLAVADTGIGIERDFLPFVFDRFRQADGSIIRGYTGLGLGLAIVRHIIELHGGSVHADSPGSDKGSVFTVLLPLRVVNVPAEISSGHDSAGLGDIDLKDVRVLVVDDEEDARILLHQVLSGHGAIVRTAPSAEAALAELAAFSPEILVSDIGMPGQDGFDLIRRIRTQRNLSPSDLPAIALTAYAGIDSRLRILSAGFQMHVPKPADPAELSAVVASLAGRLERCRTATRERQ